MKSKSLFVLLLCALLLMPLHISNAQTGDESTEDQLFEQRKALSESGLYDFSWQESLDSTGPTLAEAIDITPSLLVETSVTGPSESSGVFEGLGVIQPKRGQTFALLSSGVAGTNQPEPGIDFSPGGSEGDQLTWRLTLNVPEGPKRLSFDYNFLSAEYPDFIDTQFNDTFTALLTDNDGVRQIAGASVNSSAFFPASASLAGGSGFDIFTEDPTGVDEEFGGGLPDAGLTGFQSVSAAFEGGESIVLEFVMEDRGDGILDSAVIIDNLVISFLEVVDPNPDFLVDGEIIDDHETLAQGGRQVEGAGADGVTKVLLRSAASGPGSMEFCLVDGGAPENGGLALLGNTGRADCVDAAVTETAEGFMAFAIYQAADDFNRGGDEALTERSLSFRARFTPNTGEMVESQIPFKIVRPPVVLLHGLWSNGGTWAFPLVNDTRFSVTIADYQPTNASHFSTNLGVPSRFIREALTKVRLDKIAATQVDIAGHSMGGILSRNHVSTSSYERNENFNEGDLNKLITLNTPHTGSPVGNLVQGIRAIPFLGSAFESAMSALGHPVDQGAIEDLAKDSAAINAIEDTEVPGHALVGTGGSDALELIPGKIGAIYRIINFFADSSELFQSLQHDGIVGRQSQEGGMPNSAMTVFDGFGSIHTSVTGDSDYSNRVIELFNTAVDGSSFAEFPAPAGLPLTTALPEILAVEASLGGDLIIASPSEGTQVTPGETVNVVVELDTGTVADRVLLVGPSIALTDDAAPFEFELMIPLDAVGAFELSATGLDSDNNISSSNPVTLQVVPTATLESITIVPQNAILFAIGETRSLTVFGLYDDEVVRDITAEVEFLTSDSQIVTISAERMATAVNVGIATIVARSGSIQDSVNVSVSPENQLPVANAGPDQIVALDSVASLDGSGSFDPDNGPQSLSFEWLQIAGPEVTLSSSITATPTFQPLEVGIYAFSLVVRDGQSDSGLDTVTITVLEDPTSISLTTFEGETTMMWQEMVIALLLVLMMGVGLMVRMWRHVLRRLDA